MIQNMLITAVTPLYNKQEGQSWENQPFTTVWPEKFFHRKNKDTSRVIKKKRRRMRTAFSTEQIQTLERNYCRNKYIDRETRVELANSLNMDSERIKIWFQNRRMKEKRQLSESNDEKIIEAYNENESSDVKNASVPATSPPLAQSDYYPNGYPNEYFHTYNSLTEYSSNQYFNNPPPPVLMESDQTKCSYYNFHFNNSKSNLSTYYENTEASENRFNNTQLNSIVEFCNYNNLYHKNYYPIDMMNYQNSATSNHSIWSSDINFNENYSAAPNSYFDLN